MKRSLSICLFLLFSSFFLSAQTIEVGFAAKERDFTAQPLVIKAIDSAKKEIRMACYNFTDPKIIEALNRAAVRGVDVRIVHDFKAASEKGDGTQAIKNGGGSIRLDHKYKIMHNKFIIIDQKTLETGSYNYSTSAHKENAENVLVLWDTPLVAQEYLTEWNKLWEESTE